MNQYEEEQKFLPKKLFEDEDEPETKSTYSDRDSERMMAFSAPPILFDVGARFYEDFLQEMTQTDPELDRFGLLKTFSKPAPAETPPAGYRKFSLQTEEYNSYYAVHVPRQTYSAATPEQQILNNLDRAARWAREQYGSRAVQNMMEKGESYVKEAVFESLLQESMELTKDKFGNYVFQKIFEGGLEEHALRLLEVVKLHILEFSENCYGCRVVQKAIEFTARHPQQQAEIVQLLEPYSLYLIENINGNHVMQKCFEVVSLPLLSNTIQVVIQHYQQLSLHAYGCRVIQKYLERLNAEITQREDIRERTVQLEEEMRELRASEKLMITLLLGISVELSQCQYGNYVMQHIVSHASEYQTAIQDTFLTNFIKLSSNKYASNVIEKVIKLASQQYRDKLAKNLTESESLVTLAKHQYGNYVIQSLIHKISPAARTPLKLKLRENSQEINKSQYGRHVLLLIEKTK